MERVQRVNGFGTHEVDPASNLDYHVKNNDRRIPTAIPSVRYIPMEEVKFKLDNHYIPTMNNYQMWNGELVVTPIQRTSIDEDFGWSELREKTRNVAHDMIIPSAGFYFMHADTMPDLQVKIINATPKVMGLAHQERNKGIFDGTSMQIMYNVAAKSIEFTTANFVFPSADPTFALVGCKHDTKVMIWSEEFTKRRNAKGQDLIDKLKDLKMITSTDIKKIELNYKVVSKWSHVAEVILSFNDALDFLE